MVWIPSQRPVVIGHRGACGYRPEHSASAYRLAFEQGADYVEPDLVVTSDGVLVIRHENQISGTTDVADHPEFASRRTRKTVDGVTVTGWFTEDFTWAELQTLRCTERLPKMRPASAAFDGEFGLLRLADLFALVDEAQQGAERALGIVAELKHSAYFAGLGFDLAELFLGESRAAGWMDAGSRLIVESFEPTVLVALRALGFTGPQVLLLDAEGSPSDLAAVEGGAAPTYASFLTDEGLDRLGADGAFDGISVAKSLLFSVRGATLVADAHARGLGVFTWTLRPENVFLSPTYRTKGSPTELGDWRGEWVTVLASGVDGVFADHPDLAVAARALFAGGDETGSHTR